MTDAERVAFLPTAFASSVLVVVQVAVILYLIYDGVGVAMFVGFAVVLLQLPFLGVLFMQLVTMHQRQLTVADRRVKLIGEILQGIKILKFYCQLSLTCSPCCCPCHSASPSCV